jgi:hypothetical protein
MSLPLAPVTITTAAVGKKVDPNVVNLAKKSRKSPKIKPVNKLFAQKLLIIALIRVFFSCAALKEPSGGPKDLEGPRLVSTSVPNKSIYFREKTLSFTFNEFLSPENLQQALFISPLIEPPPEVFASGKTLHLKFKKQLLPNTTYVITLGREIKDFNEKNPLPQAYQFAFSSGDKLDTLFLRGNIRDAYSLKPAKGFLVLLFDQDTVKKKGVLGVRPQYAAQADDSGVFEFSFLKAGVYRLLAVEDKDRSFTYNLPNEKVAQSIGDTLINVQDSSSVLALRAFMPDGLPPKVKKITWLNRQNLSVSFSEPVTQAFLIKEDGSELALTERYNEDRNTLLCPIFSFSRDSVFLRFRQIADTAGNKVDTAFWSKKPQLLDSVPKIKELPPQPDKPLTRFFQSTAFLAEKDSPHIFVRDSSGKPMKDFSIKVQNYTVSIEANEKLDTLMPFQIIFEKGMKTNLAAPLDTSLTFAWKLPSVESLGSIQGKVISEQGSLLVILHGPDNKTRIQGGPIFNFKYLPPGNYRIGVIVDKDNNGLWSPGMLFPYRPPESIYFYSQPITLPPGWEVENYDLLYPPKD